MRIVLPPSESKQPGGRAGSTLDWNVLAISELGSTRREIARELVELCANPLQAVKTLGLGPKGAAWVDVDRELLGSPVMPAIERYSGVLFDALDYHTVEPKIRAVSDQTIWMFSALFGPIRASDPIPNYRLSWDSPLPGGPLKSRWARHAEAIWAEDFTIDLRSEGYRSLAPLIDGSGVYIRVVNDLGGMVAAGHANKATKGRFVRSLVESGDQFTSGDDVLAWADDHGWLMAPRADAPGELFLAVG